MKLKDLILVCIQMVLFIIFALIPAGFSGGFWIQLGSFIFVICGLVLTGIAILQLKSALTPLPSPKPEGELVITGVYKYIRHPIYTGILTITTGISLYSLSLPRAVITFILLLFFIYKSKYEETLLAEKYPCYKTYQSKTGRFLPKLLSI